MPRLYTHVSFSRDDENRARFIYTTGWPIGSLFKLVAPLESMAVEERGFPANDENLFGRIEPKLKVLIRMNFHSLLD